MSSTTDEYCNMSLARGAAENNAALSCTDIGYAFS
jgi:hypothetical protein